MKIAIFQYKCRRCGELFGSGETAESRAFVVLIHTIQNTSQCITDSAPALLTYHSCKDKGMGVGDLVGYTVKE